MSLLLDGVEARQQCLLLYYLKCMVDEKINQKVNENESQLFVSGSAPRSFLRQCRAVLQFCVWISVAAVDRRISVLLGERVSGKLHTLKSHPPSYVVPSRGHSHISIHSHTHTYSMYADITVSVYYSEMNEK